MKRILLTALICALVRPAMAQQLPPEFLPPKFNKVEFFGDTLAVIAFCGLWHDIDQYEIASAMKALGVAQADRPAIEQVREKNYQGLRGKYQTAKAHGDFCIEIRSHPFLTRVKRSGVPSVVGSDHRRQPEKIEVLGNLLGAMATCKTQLDDNKWGLFIVDMGVAVESLAGITAQAKTARQSILATHNTPEKMNAFCDQTRSNPYLIRFSN